MANTRDGHGVRLTVVALGLTLLTAACSSGKSGTSLAGNVAQPPASTPATEITTSTTGLDPAALVLSADGLGPLRFGMQAARALSGLTQALGRAEPPTLVADSVVCGATRIFKWKGLTVLVNEVSSRAVSTSGLVGWSLSGPAPAPADLKTDKGIGVGSTVKALKAAYGAAVALAPAGGKPGFKVTTATGAITGELDAAGDTGKVVSLQAGTVCGP